MQLRVMSELECKGESQRERKRKRTRKRETEEQRETERHRERDRERQRDQYLPSLVAYLFTIRLNGRRERSMSGGTDFYIIRFQSKTRNDPQKTA